MRWGTRSSPAPSWLPLHTTSSMSTSSFTRPWWPSPNPTSTFLFVCSQQQLFVCLFGVLVSHSYNTHAHANSCSLTGTFSTHTHTVSLSLSTSQPLSQPLNLSHTILPPPTHTHTHTHARTFLQAVYSFAASLGLTIFTSLLKLFFGELRPVEISVSASRRSPSCVSFAFVLQSHSHAPPCHLTSLTLVVVVFFFS